MSQADRDALIAWKTQAWADTGFVTNYNSRMHDPSGGIQIKNRVETDLCARFAIGNDILDVGIGTGRASLPLARSGRRLTGVDSSQAMLDATRANAENVPVTLVRGDVARLPFTTERFDTVMALNTVAHFPHWNDIVAEFSRFVRPGGRIVFDMFSLDHHHAVGATHGMAPEAASAAYGPTAVHDYFSRASAGDLVTVANNLGLRIVEVAPYGACFGLSSSNDWLRESMAFDRSWDRLVSWSNQFPQVFDFFVVLEQLFLAQLGTQASGRMMVVLENEPDTVANDAWHRRNREKNDALRAGLTPAALAACGVDIEALRSRLTAALTFRPNRVALFRLLTAALRTGYPVALGDWVDADAATAVTAMLERERLDRSIAAAISGLAALAGERLHYRGVDLGDAFKYELTEAILDRGLNVFETS